MNVRTRVLRFDLSPLPHALLLSRFLRVVGSMWTEIRFAHLRVPLSFSPGELIPIHTESVSPAFLRVVGSSGLEPPTSRLSAECSSQLSYGPLCLLLSGLGPTLLSSPFADLSSAGGDEGNRTPDPLLAGQVLSQLSYTPVLRVRSFKIEQQIKFSLVLLGLSIRVTTKPRPPGPVSRSP